MTDIFQDINTHITALHALNQTLERQKHLVQDIIQTLLSLQGKWLVTGVGKSGIVGKHLAATLSATGTPSTFIHPTEAMHGDLGLTQPKDGWIFLSQSGYTAELLSLISVVSYQPTIALTSNKNSPLHTQASLALTLPVVMETCPLNMAPTTSSAVMMTLAHSLATQVMQRRNVTLQDYHKRHPKGALGLCARQARHCMITHVPLVPQGTLMKHALVTMSEKGFGCVLVHDTDKKLVGLISDGDLRRAMNPNLLDQTVDQVMTVSPKHIFEHDIMREAWDIMHHEKISVLPVTDTQGHVKGLVSLYHKDFSHTL